MESTSVWPLVLTLVSPSKFGVAAVVAMCEFFCVILSAHVVEFEPVGDLGL
jgi:hypothetical protein